MADSTTNSEAKGAPIGGAAAPLRDPRLAAALRRRRRELAFKLLEGVADWDKYARSVAAAEDLEAYVDVEHYVFIDYLALWFDGGDDAFKDLYVEEKVRQAHDPRDDADARRRRLAAVLDHDEAALLDGLKGEVGPRSLEVLAEGLDRIRSILLTRPTRTPRILLVGDCLCRDALSFSMAPCMEAGVEPEPAFEVLKDGTALRSNLKKRAGERRFDMIFYSPFSYGFSPLLVPFLGPRQNLLAPGTRDAAARAALDDVDSTLRVLATEFDCPIVVHNALMAPRNSGSLAERLKNLVSLRGRRNLRRRINAAMDDLIDRSNVATFEHVFLLDETKLLDEYDEGRLSRWFYVRGRQHSAFLGKAVAPRYRDLVCAGARLLGRKLVVCDLDDTLWAGEIGEGAVSHFLDRQKILLSLKEKGIVLAVNSKNDPANVDWTGGLLKADDFVSLQISWDSKIANMKRIREATNLKYKDYVFIDDRDDQLAMTAAALPEIELLDAKSDRAWRSLEAWASILPRTNDGDRTTLYHQREARQGFLDEREREGEEDQATLFASLGVSLAIRPARRGDLQRLVELVNRSNQFNLTGGRTTFAEVKRWSEDPDATLLMGDAADKFGRMGIVCAAAVQRRDDRLLVPIFVLSCRVFGYGIETAMLNAIKRMARDLGGEAPLGVAGDYVETTHNEPCRSMYPENGFTWDGERWVHAVDADAPLVDPSWLTIDDQAASLRRADRTSASR